MTDAQIDGIVSAVRRLVPALSNVEGSAR